MTVRPEPPNPPGVWGRFDDLLSGAAMSFSSPFRVLSALEPADVVPVLAEVDRATRRGCWAFGYLAYEAAAGLDPRWAVAAGWADSGLPLVWFGLCEQPVRVPPIAVPPGRSRSYAVGPWQRGWTLPAYRRDVARVREHIAAGDTYQCNLTVRLRSHASGDLEQLYADLACAQRGSYAAYLDLGRYAIASASPELFFEWAGDKLLARPMKGTAARGRTNAEDAGQVRRMLGSDKELAENVMIVDLVRNDLSQVAQVGSVRVPVLFAPERYETVWQLTSDVTAKIRTGTGLVEVLRALFPSGSVTGAPKQRTMELIRDLEKEPRGVYCGAIGVVAPPGHTYRARFSVAIRTVTVDRSTGGAVYGTGSGITWSSDPDAEHAELLTKAAILTEPSEDFALVETMAHVPGVGLRNLDRHLGRMADSAQYFGFAFDPKTTRALAVRAVEGVGAARVRLVLESSGSLDIQVDPPPSRSPLPVRLAMDADPVDSGQHWLRHKTTRRAAYSARAARHPDVDDVILVNERGQVTETTIANLAARVDGRWWTPPEDAGCLPGVERGRLLDLGRLHERALTPTDLAAADSLAVVSSLRGWRPAVLVPAS